MVFSTLLKKLFGVVTSVGSNVLIESLISFAKAEYRRFLANNLRKLGSVSSPLCV